MDNQDLEMYQTHATSLWLLSKQPDLKLHTYRLSGAEKCWSTRLSKS